MPIKRGTLIKDRQDTINELNEFIDGIFGIAYNDNV